MIKSNFKKTSIRGMFCAVSFGALALSGCVVEPVGGVAVVGPPVVVEERRPVYVEPRPVYVQPEPELVVPIFIGGGGGGRRR